VGSDVSLRDAASGKELRSLSGHAEKVSALAFAPNGSRLVSAGADRTVCCWNTATGTILWRSATAPSDILCVGYSQLRKEDLVLAAPRTAMLQAADVLGPPGGRAAPLPLRPFPPGAPGAASQAPGGRRAAPLPLRPFPPSAEVVFAISPAAGGKWKVSRWLADDGSRLGAGRFRR
jgi:hypothetical protein